MADDAHVPHLEAFIMTNKALIRKVYIIGAVIWLAAVGAWVWGELYWDEYTHVVQNVLTGRISTVGPASIAVSWGAIFAISMPIVYGLMWISIDTKNPSLGVNNQGLFISREGLKKTFLRWNEFSQIERRNNGELWMYMQNPQEVVDRQPKAMRPFLKKTFVTERSALVIGSKEEDRKIVELVEKYASLKN